MQILLRTIACSLDDETKSYLRKKILKHEPMLPNAVVVECTFERKRGPKRDGSAIVHIAAKVPGVKKPIFAKSKASPNFIVAIDVAEAKFDRLIHKRAEMRKFDGKRSRYYLDKLKRAPRRALRLFRRKKREVL
ncbi:MAG TPA: HPF/RaiA family ribosome-associated protein [bacterium]|nr:HPF/RaiA family ribosome-associated protein [bacterium]HOR57380.1 HPF/RaiA family ribosome-associated protein [bacterium]HPL56191.1 HPF/RaiA family ribosome-associated protein [bacterium]